MVKQFLMNLMLTFIWVGLTGSFKFLDFVFGFLLSYFILMLLSRGTSGARYFSRVPKLLVFTGYFLKELFRANMQIAYDLVTPSYFMKPGIIRFPLRAETDFEINMLANIISLTPGTLILDVSDDKKVLYIHATYVTSKEDFITYLREGFEKKLLEILR